MCTQSLAHRKALQANFGPVKDFRKIDFCFGQTEKNVRNLGFKVLFYYIKIESTWGGGMINSTPIGLKSPKP